MNNSAPKNKKGRKPLPKARLLVNSSALIARGAAGAPNTFTCNPCIQTENDQCFYTKAVCPTH